MKKNFLSLLPFTLLLLSGCSYLDAKVGEVFLNKSDISEQETYLTYQQYVETADPDENTRSINDTETSEQTNDLIHVTFADNPYFETEYFTDADMKDIIDTHACYLHPGDTIYGQALSSNSSNPAPDLYALSEYRILEYDKEGNVQNTHKQSVSDDHIVYVIPEQVTSLELSVIPVGNYSDRDLSINVFYTDDAGNNCSLGNAGIWTINGETVSGNTVTINPLESYILTFTYDSENYFYVSSEPECFTRDPSSTGFVEFERADSTTEQTCYQVENKHYLQRGCQKQTAPFTSPPHAASEPPAIPSHPARPAGHSAAR